MTIRKPDRGEALTTFAGSAVATELLDDGVPTPADLLKAQKRMRETAAAVAARRLVRPPEAVLRTAAKAR